jgi:hypothetical protein
VNLQLPRSGEIDSFFKLKSEERARSWSSLSKEQVIKLRGKARSHRQEFMKHLGDNKASAKELHSSSSSNVIKHVEKFMGLTPDALSHLSLSSSGPAVSSVGLSYSLKGSLHNTPKGLQIYKTVPGRVLSGRSNRTGAGLGGFVSKTTISHSMMKGQGGNTAREESVDDFIVQRAQATHNGIVELQSIASKLFGGSSNRKTPTQEDVVDSFLEAEKQRTDSK